MENSLEKILEIISAGKNLSEEEAIEFFTSLQTETENESLIASALLTTPVTVQAQGRLLSAEPVVNTPAGMQAWKVRHLTRDDRGAQRQLLLATASVSLLGASAYS